MHALFSFALLGTTFSRSAVDNLLFKPAPHNHGWTVASNQKSGVPLTPPMNRSSDRPYSDLALHFNAFPSRLFLCAWFFFPALDADERQEILRVKRIAPNGLLSSRAERDVYAAIVGQYKGWQIASVIFCRSSGLRFGILCHLFLDFVGGELMLFAKCL